MPNIFHQSVEDILKAATPAQRIVWNDIFLRYGERAAVSQVFYQGPSAGAEFLNYVPRKMYFAYEFKLSYAGVGNIPKSAVFYDENNVVKIAHSNNVVYWDATAAAVYYQGNTEKLDNLLFSRVLFGGAVVYVDFIGYRIMY